MFRAGLKFILGIRPENKALGLKFIQGRHPENKTLGLNLKRDMVCLEGNDEQSEKMVAVYENDEVGMKFHKAQIVAIKIKSDSIECQQFRQIYPVVMIPASYFISTDGIPIEIIGGSVDPEEMCTKLDKIISVFQFDCRCNKSSTVVLQLVLLGLVTPTSVKKILIMRRSQIFSNISLSAASMSVPESSDTNAKTELAQPSSSTDPEDKTVRDVDVKSNSSMELGVNSEKSEIERKVELAQELIKIQKEAKLKEQEKEAKEKEIRRIKDGQNLQKLKQTQQEQESKQIVENLAKEKAEDKRAREEVKKQIAEDREERAAKYQKEKGELEKLKKEKQLKLKKEQEEAQNKASQRSSNARIQFRLPDGSCINETFPAIETLQSVHQFISQHMNVSPNSISMSTTFPRRVFTENDYCQSLRDLQLAPSSVIIIIPLQSVSRSADKIPSNIFWMLMNPIMHVYRMIYNLFFGIPNQPSNRKRSQQPSEDQPSTSQQGVHKRRSTGSNSVKYGNINKFRNNGDDDTDDENNTWNGNSTQHM
ncbi:UBX domain-containing protein 4 [Nymphon striatum]|nr:UBX domain-containing protein 4 [Nymphon striatum]